MGKALYRKYRSRKLSEIIGQEHITDTLNKALEKNMISHAYLLTGPRGVGKTSIARIMAHEINNLAYDEESTHLDIIEIDAASNRRIDEIRELNERIHIAPTSAKYKVYIIDEVHMLTREAFNALLKTLEEPPEHAIFILATTEPHKVPETIISRTQRYSFKPVETKKVINHLRNIAKLENIKIDDDALNLIANHGEGSFRDSISLLDQIRHTSDNISLADAQKAIGQAPSELLIKIIDSMKSKNLNDISKVLHDLHNSGVQATQVAKQLSAILRQELISLNDATTQLNNLNLLNKLLKIQSSVQPDLELELVLIGNILNDNQNTISDKTTVANKTSELKNIQQSNIDDNESPPETITNIIEESKTIETLSQAPIYKINKLDLDAWNEVLGSIKSKHNTLYGIARMAIPKFTESSVILELNFPFHKKRLEEPKNKKLLSDIINKVVGKPHTLEIILSKKSNTQPKLANKSEISTTNNDLKNISNIFGNAEIVN